MIIFNKIFARNFFSIGNQGLTIDLNKAKATAIMGASGSGKSSSLLDSIFFALYGHPYRNVNIPNVVNSINNSNCVVEIDFQNGKKEYKVRRGIKPKIFEIYEGGVLIDQDANSKDYQKWLEQTALGGMNENSFRQIVVMGSASFVPFMQLSAAQRREVIEELLDIKIFSGMLSCAKDALSAAQTNIKNVDNEISLVNEKITIHQKNLKRLDEDLTQKKQELTDRIGAEEQEIEFLEQNIKDLEDKKNPLDGKYTGVNKELKLKDAIQKKLSELEASVKQAKKTVAFFTLNDNCPTCSQVIDKDHKQKCQTEHYNVVKTVEDSVTKLKDELSKRERILEAYESLRKQIQTLDNEIYKKTSDIDSKKRYVKTLKKDLAALGAVRNEATGDIDNLNKELGVLENSKIDAITERQYFEVSVALLKDGGIKTKIISMYLPLINKLINENLRKFGLNIDFALDSEFNEVIKARHKDKFQYSNFSEGEKHRIDLAILLAWRSLAKSKNTMNCNLLIFDEILDKNLDLTASDEVLDTILKLDKKTNTFIISHRQNLKDRVQSSLTFVKKGNFTHIV